jgi:Ca2+-transporting ATPase
MRRPPRRKNEPILTQALLSRVAFSATIVALGTLFIYGYALGDAHMSRREQTMVRSAHIRRTCARPADPLVCRRSRRSCSSTSCPRSRTAASGARSVESDAARHRRRRRLTLVYVVPLQAVFQMEALGGADMALVLALVGEAFFYVETWARRLGYSQL